jgi:hypothetical protein
MEKNLFRMVAVHLIWNCERVEWPLLGMMAPSLL